MSEPTPQQLAFPMKCQEKVGFLIPRPCPNPAAVQCAVCHKPVCGDHTANLPTGTLACTSCAAAQNVGPGVQQRAYRDYYGYDPGWYGWGGMYGGPGWGYTHEDYEAFRPGQSAETQPDVAESLEGS